MKQFALLIFSLYIASPVAAQWLPVGEHIRTPWAEQVSPANVLPEYPRPLMERNEWMNLNGLWDFAVVSTREATPTTYTRQILVPFAVESSLSGIGEAVSGEQELCYHRTFAIPARWKDRRVLLHFGAVDWRAEVSVNGVLIGRHTGGYTPFSFDITPYLNQGGRQEVAVRVWDPTDTWYQPRGKQVSVPDNIVYTAVSGIWQTVWIEPVEEHCITALRITPDIDRSLVSIQAESSGITRGDYMEARLVVAGQTVATGKAAAGETLNIHVSDPQLWTPDTPFLYDLEVSLYAGGRRTDKVRSYCALRKISAVKDSTGVMRLALNNGILYQMGMLDQGWWPDGLYTAPTDEALASDIVRAKRLGYNMLRKHIKVEPARWYMHADRLGILVWQDMPSGDNNYGREWQDGMRNYADLERPAGRSAEARNNYRREWQDIIDALYSHPSIVMWIPFNEGWGQFDTMQMAEWTKAYDPSRILNPASGGNFYHTGDVLDLHHYPDPEMFLYDPDRVNVLGEYGGIGMAVEGHTWNRDKNFSYGGLLTTTREVTDRYLELLAKLKSLGRFAGAIYTQATDVERELNGVVTYDRCVMKVDEDALRRAHEDLIHTYSAQ
jgi:beta-galactosidase/beta-glucuronidase